MFARYNFVRNQIKQLDVHVHAVPYRVFVKSGQPAKIATYFGICAGYFSRTYFASSIFLKSIFLLRFGSGSVGSRRTNQNHPCKWSVAETGNWSCGMAKQQNLFLILAFVKSKSCWKRQANILNAHNISQFKSVCPCPALSVTCCFKLLSRVNSYPGRFVSESIRTQAWTFHTLTLE